MIVCCLQGGACYEEVRDLWQRVSKAEQAAANASSELQSHKDAAEHATLQLKVIGCSHTTALPLDPPSE